MKSLVAVCLFVVAITVAAVANAAESWVYGNGGDKIAAKEAALAVASANLPAGVPFNVVDENYVVNGTVASTGGSVPTGYTCNILVRYGRGYSEGDGVRVYHSTTRDFREARDAKATRAAKEANAATKRAKTTNATNRPKTTNATKVNIPPKIHGTMK